MAERKRPEDAYYQQEHSRSASDRDFAIQVLPTGDSQNDREDFGDQPEANGHMQKQMSLVVREMKARQNESQHGQEKWD
jgi:hypothetical protein